MECGKANSNLATLLRGKLADHYIDLNDATKGRLTADEDSVFPVRQLPIRRLPIRRLPIRRLNKNRPRPYRPYGPKRMNFVFL